MFFFLNKIVQGTILMVMGLLFGISSVWAQAIPDINSLTAATPAGDWSVRMWQSLFGDFAINPFSTLGGPTTLLGGVFIIFNGCIFVVGFAWALYGVMGGVVATAHEGEVLGKRMSTIWFPIRMITGIAGMVPIFGGFTLTQAIMMSLTTIGIGIGNAMWTGAVNNTSQFQALMNNQNFSPSSTSQIRDAAKNMFLSNVCVIAQNDVGAGTPALNASEVVSVNNSVDAASNTSRYTYGSLADPQKCGYVSVTATVREQSSSTSFRTNAVNYAAISAAAANAYIQGMGGLQNNISNMATQWYRARDAAVNAGTAVPPIPVDAIDAAVNDFSRNAMAAIAQYNIDGGAIEASVRQNMLAVGWLGAGAWFSTFAEVNAAIADATKGPVINSSALEGKTLTTTAFNSLEAVKKSYEEAMGARASGAQTGDSSKALLDSAIQDSCAGSNAVAGAVGTATGNCSLGQGIVSAAIRASAIGSGGGGNGAGTVGIDSTGFVNPIIMMKNVGDYVMSFSTGVLTVSAVGELGATMAAKGGSMVSGIPLVGGVLSAIPKAVAETAASVFSVIKVLAMVTLVLGAAMAIYIPMVPFITWIGAVLAYAASMIEGLAGATLHAMAHLDGDGDGMGQRTSHGYMFYINALARPALMIIGFLVASALMIAVGTLQAHMFLPAMANVQGNSVTGIASIAMFLIIFFVMNLTLITASFNLIYVITDQVIGFIGGQVDSKLGRDTEDKVNNMFMMAARVGPGAIGDGRRALAGVKAARADGLAGALKDKGSGA